MIKQLKTTTIWYHVVFLVTIFFGSPLVTKACSGRLKDLPQVLKEAERDSIRKIEYLASQYFHSLLNKYRRQQKLDTLAFSAAHWMAARNHSMWMSHYSLTHEQRHHSRCFTGKLPGDRIKYVAPEYDWTGENLLTDFSYKKNLSVDAAALKIAESAFRLWIQSKGHHKIITLKTHQLEGTAFIIDDEGKVWGTSLFGYHSSSGNVDGYEFLQKPTFGSIPHRWRAFTLKQHLVPQIPKENGCQKMGGTD
jgi:uncharacterized protein YkwD